MGGEPKQFRLLGGAPVMCWSARPLLDSITGPLVIVLPRDSIEEGAQLLEEHLSDRSGRIRLAAGGARRQDSVRAGLAALQEEAGTVLVHDASRPFASADLAARVARRAAGRWAVVPALPIPDTLKEVEGSRVVRTHDRIRFVAAQTPQGFPIELLRRAHAETALNDATDDAALCEAAGVAVSWIPGEATNRKLTDAGDWAWAEERVAAGAVRWG